MLIGTETDPTIFSVHPLVVFVLLNVYTTEKTTYTLYHAL